jgi:hypothetical protein
LRRAQDNRVPAGPIHVHESVVVAPTAKQLRAEAEQFSKVSKDLGEVLELEVKRKTLAIMKLIEEKIPDKAAEAQPIIMKPILPMVVNDMMQKEAVLELAKKHYQNLIESESVNMDLTEENMKLRDKQKKLFRELDRTKKEVKKE